MDGKALPQFLNRFQFSNDWFSGNEKHFSKFLSHLSGAPCQLLEIGSHEGRSAVWMLENLCNHPAAFLQCIDLHEQPNFWSNVKSAANGDKLDLQIGLSRKILRSFPEAAFDFIYIDGGHRAVEVIEDAILAFRALKPGGIIAFDDYLWKTPESSRDTPRPAIDAFLSIYRDHIIVLMKQYQVWIRKERD